MNSVQKVICVKVRSNTFAFSSAFNGTCAFHVESLSVTYTRRFHVSPRWSFQAVHKKNGKTLLVLYEHNAILCLTQGRLQVNSVTWAHRIFHERYIRN